MLAAVVCVLVSLRGVGRASPRALLSAQTLDTPSYVNGAGERRRRLLAALLTVVAACLIVLAFVNGS